MMVAHAGERLPAVVRQGEGILCLSSQTHATVGAHQIGIKRKKKLKTICEQNQKRMLRTNVELVLFGTIMSLFFN